ncbi:hypothetical protein EVAR_24599_1 [Eumeta japonica]|uniref:Uncharacterized protein n=1 Tax=Eumeta variegata TaxID=151549 RepID=A0A4C1W6L8_EUMVA|nr:hypothetical protein EVAR_24599_1 [Eumeta japonica]
MRSIELSPVSEVSLHASLEVVRARLPQILKLVLCAPNNGQTHSSLERARLLSRDSHRRGITAIDLCNIDLP